MHFKIVFAILTCSFLRAAALPEEFDISHLLVRQAQCQNPGFLPCYPAGSSSLGSPDFIDDPMSYLNSMTTSGIGDLRGKKKRESIIRRQAALCCSPAVKCLVLKNYNIPFCYEPSSTAFVFADGSGGKVSTGETFDTQGNSINLYTGDYRFANGTTGNYYKERNLPVPNTSTVGNAQATVATSPLSSSVPTATRVTTTIPTQSTSEAVKLYFIPKNVFAAVITLLCLAFMW